MRSHQQVGLDRLRDAMEDQSHAHGSDKKANDARRRVDASRADAAYDRVGVGENQISRDHRK